MSVRSFADGLGLFSSAACLAHCLAVPIVLVVGGALPTPLLPHQAFHQYLLWAILPTALVAFGVGCLRHKDRRVLVLGSLGLLGLLLSAVLAHEPVGETGERVLAVLSSSLLVVAHARNFRLCRAGHCDHEEA